MVDIKPFKAIRYSEKAGNMDNLIAQPYDKITPEMQKEYYEKSEYNYSKLTLPIEENRYAIAKQRLDAWIKEGIFERDDTSAIYVYYQEYELFGQKFIRKGFIGALRLHPFEENIVLPHERTHKGPKIDRLDMLKATVHNLETGFILYSDPEKKTISIFDEMTKSEPIIKTIDSLGVLNKLWKLTDKQKILVIQSVFENQQLVIADGHHRYETACTYRDMRRDEMEKWHENDSYNFRMTYLVPIEDEGLVILATHRCLAKEKVTEEKMMELKEFFEIDEISKSEIPDFLKKNMDKHVFVLYQDRRALSFVMKNIADVNRYVTDASEEYKQLDVVILRDMIFHGIMGLGDLHIDDDIFYERWWDEAIEKADQGKYQSVFMLNPTKAEEVLSVSKNHERMPQKSTDFYPKMVSGLTMFSVQEGEKLE
ncbi:MAG: DUF1015 domain-containing protein [Candidatus Heimdallarchaeota archaeon]|nr:DUF1015 domain-containing protein [Candidatus Heimdallarchaeota archaeon]